MRPRLVALSALLATLVSQPADAQTGPAAGGRAASGRAPRRRSRMLRAMPLVDGHNDLPWAIRGATTAPHDVAAYDLRRRTPGTPTSPG